MWLCVLRVPDGVIAIVCAMVKVRKKVHESIELIKEKKRVQAKEFVDSAEHDNR